MKSLSTQSGYKISVLSYDLNNHMLTIVPNKGDVVNIALNKSEIIALCSLVENSLNIQTLNAEIP
jgi:hypothetical protein